MASIATLLTGIQPTGALHIGNYLGAISNILFLQHSPLYSTRYMMIADSHSLTNSLTYDHSLSSFNHSIGANTLTMAKTFLASGLSPQRTTMFVQSQVKEHMELSWVLQCITPQNWLNSMIQYKEKSHSQSGIGIYVYPILMAADVLLYKATHVPVGSDQKQHLELVSKILERFNTIFNCSFFPPVNYVESRVPKVMSLTDPSKKMSKTDPNDRSRINLLDSESLIREKIKKAVTDMDGRTVTYSDGRPGLSNLIRVYCELKRISPAECEKQMSGLGVKQFKEVLASAIVQKLGEIQRNTEGISDEETRRVFKEGAQKASIEAAQNMLQIKQIMSMFV